MGVGMDEDLISQMLKKPLVKAKELEMVLRNNGWKRREPPQNQPHYFSPGCPDYIVVDRRRGAETQQNPKLLRKYLKRILDVLRLEQEKKDEK
jgi:hypothetical protein